MPGILSQLFPFNATLWATAGTRDATSWLHIDDHGLVTIITVVTGSKYWVIARPKRGCNKGSDGDMGSSNAFGGGWEPHLACDDLWDHEGILLEAGDIL